MDYTPRTLDEIRRERKMILITGDIHGSHDIHKLSNKGNPDFKDIFNKHGKG